MTHVRHRALVFDARLFAGNAADDTLVTGGTFRFCRLMCPCVKRRNIMLNDKRRSLLNSALFRADNRTGQKTFSPFSLALILTFDFAALSELRSCPEVRSQRFVPVGTLRRHKLHIARFRVKHESSFISLLPSSHKSLRFCGSPVTRSWRLLRWGTYPVRTVMQFSTKTGQPHGERTAKTGILCGGTRLMPTVPYFDQRQVLACRFLCCDGFS